MAYSRIWVDSRGVFRSIVDNCAVRANYHQVRRVIGKTRLQGFVKGFGRKWNGLTSNQLHQFPAVRRNELVGRRLLPLRVADFVNFDDQVALLQPVLRRTAYCGPNRFQSPPG